MRLNVKGCISLPLLFDDLMLYPCLGLLPSTSALPCARCATFNLRKFRVKQCASAVAGQGLAVRVLDSRSLKVQI